MSKKLTANVAVDGTMYGPDYPANKVTDEVAKQITNPRAWGKGQDADADSGSNAPKTLDDMTAGELKAEIDTRNEGREDDAKISKSGNKAELLEALKADDLAAAGA